MNKMAGKPYKHLQSQGLVKMGYHCSKFNAYCSLIWWGKKKMVKKIRPHILNDVGVAAAELLKKRGKKKKKGLDWDLNLGRLCGRSNQILSTCYGGFMTNTDKFKLIKVNMSSERYLHSDKCVIGVFLHIVE